MVGSELQYASIDAGASGDNTLVALVSGKRIRVLSLFVVASAAVTVRFESGTGGTALTGQMQVGANGNINMPFNPEGWFQAVAGQLLNMELGSATSVDGCLTYVLVD